MVKCATEVARLHKVSKSCTQNRPSPKVHSRSGELNWELRIEIEFNFFTA